MFNLNDRYTLAQPFSNGYVRVNAGATGVVIDIDPEEGGIVLALDEPHPSAACWNNRLPFSQDSVAAMLRPYTPPAQRSSFTLQRMAYLAVIFGVGVMTLSASTLLHPGNSTTAAPVSHQAARTAPDRTPNMNAATDKPFSFDPFPAPEVRQPEPVEFWPLRV